LLIVGLTGSIGMGKTTTAGMFRAAGAPVHDSDAAVHQLYASSAAALIGEVFPGVVEDGRVNRAALAEKVLGNAQALKQLENIVHPLVSKDRQAFLEKARRNRHPVCILDIPLLFETRAELSVDLTLVVTASASVQKSRVMARAGMTEEKFHAILARQVPDAEKCMKAHGIIDTTLGLDSAQRQVLALLRALSR
jgi:dephospho-CoA kinase